MKLEEITEAEYENFFECESKYYFGNGCVFDKATDNLVAFDWYESAMKYYKVVKP